MKTSDRFHLALLIGAAFLMDLTVRAGSQAYQEGGIAFGGTAFQLGLLGAISAFFYAFMCPIAGGASDRIGRRASTCVSGLGLMAAFVLAAWARSITQLMALTVISGTATAFFWPATQAWIADLGGRGRKALTRNLGWFNILWSSGLTVGPLVTGYLWKFGRAGGHSQEIVFRLVAGLGLGLAALMLFIRPRSAQAHENGDNGVPAEVPHEETPIYLRAAWVGVFAGWFAGGVIGSLFPKLGEQLHYDERMRGLLCSAYHLGQLAMFILTSVRTGWQYRRWPLVVAELVGAAALVAVFWANRPALFAGAFFLAGMASGAPYVASLFYSLHGRTAAQGRTTGWHECILASGIVLGPLLGSVAAQHLSIRAPYPLAGAVLVLAVFVQWWIWSARKRAPV